jgi:lysophospholipase L1-like esterase
MCTIATHACYVVTLVFKSGKCGARTMRIAATIIIICLVSCKGNSDYIPPPVAKAPPNTVAFMGDSITALWDLADYDSSPTLNFGISGDNTEQMLARFHNQVIDSDPAVVVILGGINDFQERGASGTNTDAIKAMASAASTAGIKVILCSVLPTDYPNPNLNLPEIEAFNQDLLQLAQESGYLYADYYDVMLNADGTTDDSLFMDHIHPNSAGYARMWTVLAPLIEEDLQ